MSGLRKMLLAPHISGCVLLLGILALSALACTASATPTTAPAAPTQPPPPTVDEAAPAAPPEVQSETAPETIVDMNIVGFWRTKIVTKQVIIFEFQEGGQTIWHYRYNNGQKNDNPGRYSLVGDRLTVDIDGPQELTVKIEGDTLILTGSDGNILTFQKVASPDDLGSTASTNFSQDIVNRWQDTIAQEWLDFKADGTVSITSSGSSTSGTYTLATNYLDMKLDNQTSPSSFRVEIDGNILTLYAEDGSFVDYVK